MEVVLSDAEKIFKLFLLCVPGMSQMSPIIYIDSKKNNRRNIMRDQIKQMKDFPLTTC